MCKPCFVLNATHLSDYMYFGIPKFWYEFLTSNLEIQVRENNSYDPHVGKCLILILILSQSCFIVYFNINAFYHDIL